MPSVALALADGIFNRTQGPSGVLSLGPAPMATTFPGDTDWWLVTGAAWTIDDDTATMANTDGGDNFLNLIYPIQQTTAAAVTFRVVATGTGITGSVDADSWGINLILTDSGGLSGKILADVEAAFPVGTWPTTQFSITATPTAPAYYVYAYIFARNSVGTITVSDAEVFQASGAAAPYGTWQSAVIDAWQATDAPITTGTLALKQWGFYYGDLANVDDMDSIEHSIAALSAFPRLVCNEPGQNTTTRQQAVQAALTAAIDVYGYINTGIGESSRNGCIPLESTIEAAIDRCAAAGYAGVFFDGDGMPGVPQDYHNTLVDYVHTAGLKVMSNSHPQDRLTSTVDTSVLRVNDVALALSPTGSGTSLPAGTYTATYTCCSPDGEGTASPTQTVTIAEGQEIAVGTITGKDTNTQTVNLYVSTAGSSTVRLLMTGWDGSATTITTLPAGTQPEPPTESTAYVSNPTGVASTMTTGDWCLWESFYSRSDNEYAGVPEGSFADVLDEYVAGVTLAHSCSVSLAGLAYALTGTALTDTVDQTNSYLLAAGLGFDGWRYGGSTALNTLTWGPLATPPAIGGSLTTAISDALSALDPPTWRAVTDAGVIWFSATDSPVTRDSGTFAVGSTVPVVTLHAPTASVPDGRVTALTQGSANGTSSWSKYDPRSPTRYVQYTLTLQAEE